MPNEIGQWNLISFNNTWYKQSSPDFLSKTEIADIVDIQLLITLYIVWLLYRNQLNRNML